MEKHQHHHLGPKKFKEYFFEGLMIFFAVSVGFIAENIREEMSMREKENGLIESFVLNLKTDTSSLRSNIERNLRKNQILDSLLLLANEDLTQPNNQYNFYNYFIKGAYMSLFIPSDAAMTQIKTDGGLSIISKKGVLDSILKYDNQNKIIERHNGVYTEESENLWRSAFEIMEIRVLKDTSYIDFFNGRVMKNKMPPPIVNNPDEKRIFFGTLTRVLLLTQVNRNHMAVQLEEAKRLIKYLEANYHFK